MQTRLWQNLLIFKNQSSFWGFNATTLGIAELSPEAIAALDKDQHHLSIDESEALKALREWTLESHPALPTQTTINPRSLTINVTQICNLHCSYCAAGGDGSYGAPSKKISVEKTLPQLKWFLEKCPSHEPFNINFLGGEPLLYPQGIKLITDYAREVALERNIDLSFSIVTNGTLITQEVAKLLVENQINVTLSLDGPPEVNDQVRITKSGKGSTAQVVEGVRNLKKIDPKIKINVNGVFGKANPDPFTAYVFYNELGLSSFEFTFDHEIEDPQINKIFVEGFKKILQAAYEKGAESELRKIIMVNKVFDNLDRQTAVRHFCGAGNSFFMIDAKNQVFACPWDVNDPSEKLGEGLFLDEKATAKYLDPLSKQVECQSCWAKNLCAGGCSYVHKVGTGDKNKPLKSFCERTRNLLFASMLYYVRCRSSCESSSEGLTGGGNKEILN